MASGLSCFFWVVYVRKMIRYMYIYAVRWDLDMCFLSLTPRNTDAVQRCE